MTRTLLVCLAILTLPQVALAEDREKLFDYLVTKAKEGRSCK